MAQGKKSEHGYEELASSIKQGQVGCFYIFHGEERYLLEHSLAQLRKHICPSGLDGFNYKRFEGKAIKPEDIEEAVNALTMLSERTLVEIYDPMLFNGRKGSITEEDDELEENANPTKAKNPADSAIMHLAEILTDLPEYVCVVLIYDTVRYSPDLRKKLDKEMLKRAIVVEFSVQDQSKLVKWITRHFEANGKQISRADAQYLAEITDGLMSALAGEIEKVTAFSNSDAIKRADIDAVVMPVLNAVIYRLTDALLAHQYSVSMSILDELFRMREPAHKILYSISTKMRQLIAARVCIENNLGKSAFMKMTGIAHDFQATMLLNTARKTTLDDCRAAALLCTTAAYDLNSASEPESRLVELVTRMAL